MDESMIVLGYFNIPLSPLNKFTRQDISKDIRALNEILKAGTLYRYFLLQKAEHKFSNIP